MSIVSPWKAQGLHAWVQSSVLEAVWNMGIRKCQGSIAYSFANSSEVCICTENNTDYFLPHLF